MNRNRKTIALTVTALMTALLCVAGPFSIPLGPVPLSLATLMIYLAAYILEPADATAAVCIYVLLGLTGLPVFTGFSGGAAKLFGPTGGYILGYIPTAAAAGILMRGCRKSRILCVLSMALATCILYIAGTVWLKYSTGMSFEAALWAGVIPFIPGDLIKMVMASMLGSTVRSRLLDAGLLPGMGSASPRS